MPAYTYECETCEDVFDVRRSMTDDSPVVCTTCAGSRVRQVYYAPAMVGRSSSGSASQARAANAAYMNGGGGGCGSSCGCH
ncbi:MAG: zinc ribbon domain-containing protein [Chloroflexota bacterium]|nr:zinc ribbon domain-containing protein [Chloroflexota bacterium]